MIVNRQGGAAPCLVLVGGSVAEAGDLQHVVGVSTLTAGHLALVPPLKAALDQAGRSDIMIVIGGVIPPEDIQRLLDMGAAAIFPPGTVIPDAALALLDKLNRRLGYAQKAAE